ncbi:Oxidoreductase htatip2 [Coemansia thaxteri]|nr:Oxidoreductase htatip2 [Coemansia thaxteri]KAJ2473085.1 Oxidoreductase htatip2 [Coemansia sp. RSA 2320]KAJ2473646.1 Oxidoreductase htatip2 [Coemansia sp. RSA 2322]
MSTIADAAANASAAAADAGAKAAAGAADTGANAAANATDAGANAADAASPSTDSDTDTDTKTTTDAKPVAIAVTDDNPVLGRTFTKAASKFKRKSPGKTALVLGGTGQVGREVVKHLMASDAFDKVAVFARRPIEYTGANAEKLVQNPIDFEDSEKLKSDFSGFTHAFSCLGTTRSKSGSDGFYKVDHDYALNAARACKEAGVEHYSICSSAGADKSSRMLYMRTKGEVESEVVGMGFPRASVFRPAMLECRREESRPVEKLASLILPVVKLIMPNSAAIPTSTVAWAMVSNAFAPVEAPATESFSNADMLDKFKKAKK